jgi:Protein of unknown function (DUF2752)
LSPLLRAAGGILVVAAVGAVAAGALTGDATRAALAEGGPACLFRHLTGVVCPFCGMTHAALALGAWRWSEALDQHPLAPLVLLATAWCGICLARGRPLHLFGRPIAARAVIAAVLVIWTWNLVAHA